MDLRKKVFSAIVFLLVLGICAFTYGQTLTGAIKGVVEDPDGVPLPGVTVEIQGPALIGGLKSTITSDRGLYRFANLPPGTYELTFTLGAFQTVNRTGLIVQVDTTINENVTMSMTTLEEEVTVLAETPVVDVTKSGISTNWQTEMMDNLPLLRTCFFDLVNSTPGVWSHYGNTDSTRSVAYGTSSESNVYLFDGVDTTAPDYGAGWAWLNPDVIQEIQVIGIGAKAEYSNFMGATINIVTKSGGNEFHGGAGALFQFDSMMADNSAAYLDGLIDNGYLSEDERFSPHRETWRDLSFQIGGPLLRDKIWFYVSVWHQYDANSPAGTNPDFFTTFDDTQTFFKATIQLTKNIKLSGFFNHEWYDLPDALTPDVEGLDTIGSERGKLPTASVGLTGVLSDTTYFELKYNYTGGNDFWESITYSLEPQYYDWETDFTSGGPGSNFFYWPERHGFHANISHFAEDFVGGDHDFKFGVQYTKASTKNRFGYTGIGANYANYYGYQYRYELAPYQYGASSDQIGIFLDDTFSVGDRLTLNIGFRYDHNTGSIDDQPLLDVDPVSFEWSESSTVVTGVPDIVKWRVFSPRIGFAYKLTSDGKTLLRANAGRYYDQMIYGNWMVPAPTSPTWIMSFLDGDDWIEIFAIPPELTGVDSGLKNPYSDQISIGLDRELFTDFGLSVTYMEKWTKNMIGFDTAQGSWNDYYTLISAPDPYAGGTIQGYNLIGAQPELQITNPDRYFTRFRMLSIEFRKRFSNRWQLSASFTFSKSWGLNPRGSNRQIFGENILWSTSSAKDPNHLLNIEGPLAGDRPFSMKILGTYLFPWDISVSTNFQIQTGSPFSRLVSVFGLNQGNQTVAAEARGDNGHRLDTSYLLDMSVEKNIRISGRFSVQARFEVFNILNRATSTGMIDYSLSAGQTFIPNFIWSPRRAQVGLRLRF